jgi:TolB-like protein/DNA-binding winged helix-turn-helix (wHTH) protein
MSTSPQTPRAVRFGPFEADLRSAELHRDGHTIKVQEQPFQVLATLLEHPGEIVTREELRQRLWPAETFVDFDHSLATAILKIRDALEDSAGEPHFVETVPRRGYRFIAPVEAVPPEVEAGVEAAVLAGEPVRKVSRRWLLVLAGAALASALAILLGLNIAGLRDRLPGPGAAHIDSIAVLPFENVGGNPQTAYLSDGLTGTLINQLAQLPGLQVMGRSTVYQYKQAGIAPRRVGRELNVGAVVTGRVRQQGSNLIVGVEMMDVAHGTQIWGEQFNRKMEDLFSLQQEIARTVAERLSVKLTRQGRQVLARRDSPNTRAYELYLKSRASAWELTNSEELPMAEQYAHLAIQADPNFALGYAALADVYAMAGKFDVRPAAEVFPKARKAALKALELDNTLPDPHGSLAIVKLNYDWDWAGAEREIQRALELAPNRGDFHGLKALHLLVVGRTEDAVAEAQRAVELDPYAQRLVLITVYLNARRYDGVIREVKRVLEYKPDIVPTAMAYAYFLQGKYDEYFAVVEKYPRILGLNAENVPLARKVFERGGPQGFLDWVVGIKEKRFEQGQPSSLFDVAAWSASADHKDEAFHWLERGYQEHSFTMLSLRTFPAWDSLRSDPRFQNLLRRMNYPPLPTDRK